MPRRESYSDSFSGAADKSLKAILQSGTDLDDAPKLRKILLKIINNELTARQKQIIVLYYYKDTDIVRIGEQLGISPQAVSAAMSRARLKIYRILQYYF